MAKTLDEWQAIYNQKAPTPLRLNDRSQVEYDPEKGFLVWEESPETGVFFAADVCGEALFWLNRAKDIAKERGLRRLVCINNRDPAAMRAMMGFERIAYVFSLEV